MKAQNKTVLLVVLFVCLFVFGFFPATSSAQTNLWTLNKYAWLPGFPNVPVSQLTLAVGQQLTINYSIIVSLQDPSIAPSPPQTPWIDVWDQTPTPRVYLGTVYWPEGPFPTTFTYSTYIGPFNECGVYTVENEAYICNGTTFTWPITVNVPCETGCTLTPGYWKTHSLLGPAPYDDNWAMLEGGLGQDTIFFLSGQTWYEVLWTPPAKGNAYYILAHAFIAAKLNLLNGASSTPEVDAVLIDAEAFFASTAPTTTLPKALRKQIINNAGILDNYNNGLIGPGHCSEEGTK